MLNAGLGRPWTPILLYTLGLVLHVTTLLVLSFHINFPCWIPSYPLFLVGFLRSGTDESLMYFNGSQIRREGQGILNVPIFRVLMTVLEAHRQMYYNRRSINPTGLKEG